MFNQLQIELLYAHAFLTFPQNQMKFHKKKSKKAAFNVYKENTNFQQLLLPIISRLPTPYNLQLLLSFHCLHSSRTCQAQTLNSSQPFTSFLSHSHSLSSSKNVANDIQNLQYNVHIPQMQTHSFHFTSFQIHRIFHFSCPLQFTDFWNCGLTDRQRSTEVKPSQVNCAK